MFGSKVQNDDAGLLRLQKGIASDRLRLQQRLELADADLPVEETPRHGVSGRLYQVFVDLGEA